jgi:nascent polypeptide-associated complex subunit alpha
LSYQIAGNVKSVEKSIAMEITDDDIKMVMEKTGVTKEKAEEALRNANGDIAQAILALTG